MRFVSPPPSVVSAATSACDSGSLQSFFASTYRHPHSLPSITSHAPLSLPTASHHDSEADCRNAVSWIREITREPVETEATTIDKSLVLARVITNESPQAEMQELMDCVGDCAHELQKEAAEDPTGDTAQQLQKFKADLRRRGLNLDFLTKPWSEKNMRDTLGVMAIICLLFFSALGTGYILGKPCYKALLRWSFRWLRQTPPDAPGVRGYLRRRWFPPPVPAPADAPFQPGVEMEPISIESTPAPSMHSFETSAAPSITSGRLPQAEAALSPEEHPGVTSAARSSDGESPEADSPTEELSEAAPEEFVLPGNVNSDSTEIGEGEEGRREGTAESPRDAL